MNDHVDQTIPSDNPYVGPQTFQREHKDLFFGRDVEARELLYRVTANRLVLFYAQSAAGKSSLLNVRLAPDLEERGFEVLPIGRISGEEWPQEPDFNPFVRNLTASIIPKSKNPEVYSHLSLSDFLLGLVEAGDEYHFVAEGDLLGDASEPPEQLEPAAGEELRPRVLIIDQFEEILTTNLPSWKKRGAFFEQLSRAMEDDPYLWVVLTMREDYVAGLDPYAHLVPGNLQIRYYMQRLGWDAALEAIREPAARAHRPFSEGVAEELAQELSLIRVPGQEETIPGPFIEPVQLQVACYELWNELGQRDKEEKKPARRITTEDLELVPVAKALRVFYERVVGDTVEKYPRISEFAIRSWFEEDLITEAKTRNLVRQDEKEHRTGRLNNEIVTFLQEKFLVRREPRAGGYWIELIHDSFVEPILESRKIWRNKYPLVEVALAWKAAGEDESMLYTGSDLRSARQTSDLKPLGQTVADFLRASHAKEASQQEYAAKIAQKRRLLEGEQFGAELGWGIIFVYDADPAVKEALSELIQLRRAQAGQYFRLYEGGDGYRPGETADKFLARHGVEPGVLDPGKVPYYLLLVGSPEEIPWSFEYQLNLEYGVGRIHFEHLEDYARYARSVTTVESGLAFPPKALLFNVNNPDDKATDLSDQYLARPLFESLSQHFVDWHITLCATEEATKQNLSTLFTSDRRPTFLFTSGHVLNYTNLEALGPEIARRHAGAILCQDWPGPRQWAGKKLSPDLYFSVDDIGTDARFLGMVAFLWGGSTVGTPLYDDFYKARSRPRKQTAPKPFVARLPQAMLSHPNGGALAVIGHVDDAWGYSFYWPQTRSGAQNGVFDQALSRLLDGYPVGAAMDAFGRRYGQLAAILSLELERIDHGEKEDPYHLANMWTATNDARNYVIFGDPAVRISVAERWTLDEWPTIEPVTLAEAPPAAYKPPESTQTVLPVETESGERLHYFNGVDGESGEYTWPPMTATELSAMILGEASVESLDELRSRLRPRDISF